MLFNRDKFFKHYRDQFSTLPKYAKNGLEFLLSKIESDPEWTELSHVAYFLATIKHETGHTFLPIPEKRAKAGTKVRVLQDRYWSTGFYGRGYIQITWEKNYKRFGIANNPKLALEPETAYKIASDGMRKGMFTGKKLSDYLTQSKTDFKNARKIVNGLDKAADIALIARQFMAILGASQEIPSPPIVQEPEPTAEPPQPAEDQAPSTAEQTASPSLTSKIRNAYCNASEGEKSLVSRIMQLGWTGIAGLVTFVQTNQIKILIAVLVLMLGFWVFNRYARRQDEKTIKGLNNGKST